MKNKLICGFIVTLIVVISTAVIFVNNNKSITYKGDFDGDDGTKVKEQIVNKEEVVEETVEMATVKFETNGGTSFSNQVVEKGTKTTAPSDSSKKEPEKESIKESKKEEIIDDKKYTVTFNSNGGSKINSQIISEDSNVIKPSNPTKKGYIFLEWTLEGDAYDFNTKINKNITLTANWALLGDANNDGVINAADTTILMRYLSGWDIKISLASADVNADGEVDDIDVNIITRYRMKEIDTLPYNSGAKYSISYNLNGGTFEKNEYVPLKYAEITTSIIYGEISVIKEGYIFTGWTGSNGNIPQKNIEIKKGTTGNLQYNANWILYGDVNNDQKINSTDTILIRKYIEKNVEFTAIQKEASDLNKDGKIDNIDVDIIRKYIAGGYGIDKLPYTS